MTFEEAQDLIYCHSRLAFVDGHEEDDSFLEFEKYPTTAGWHQAKGGWWHECWLLDGKIIVNSHGETTVLWHAENAERSRFCADYSEAEWEERQIRIATRIAAIVRGVEV